MKQRGFTLIELLIVVAIIAILAAIAVPNFLEAQTRSRVSRAMNDLRTLSVAMESYRIDNNTYPAAGMVSPLAGHDTYSALDRRLLTTPISYCSSVPPDVFMIVAGISNPWYRIYGVCYVATSNLSTYPSGYRRDYDVYPKTAWMTWSYGPDLVTQTGGYFSLPRVIQNESTAPPLAGYGIRYDGTNGTVSAGDIYRFEGEAITRDN